MRKSWNAVCAGVILALAVGGQVPSPTAHTNSILAYVKETWTTLTRSNKDLANAAVDTKIKPDPD